MKLLLSFVLASAAVACARSAEAARKPNFVVIAADDMGYADLSGYGNDRYRTPHVDALAKEGLRFTDFHSNGAVCSPTRAALLTGRYQQRSGVDEVAFADPARGMREDYGLRATEVTFAKLLKAAGYATAIVGKWHLGYAKKFNPMHHGFDRFRGYVSGNVDFHSHVDGAEFADWWHDLELRDEPGYSTHLITRHAVRFIEDNRERPFCLYVAHEAPHSPYQGPNDPPVRGKGKRPPLREASEIRRAYREMVQEMDKGVGEIAAALRRLELERDTLVFFFSDNGATREGNNGGWNGSKGTLWEGGHRVPGIAWWPGKIRAGAVTDQTAMGMDLLPTMLELAGAKAPAGRSFDGVSLAPILLEGGALPPRTLFWGYNGSYAVRQGAWKLLAGARQDESAALFNLAEDPGEKTDLAAKEPARVAELRRALENWQEQVWRDAARAKR